MKIEMKDKEELIKQYEKLKNLEKLRKDEILKLRREIREKQDIIKKIQKKENSNLKNQSEINSEIKNMFQALEKGDGYNSKLICNHFGVNSESGIFRISMSKWGKNTQLVIEIKENQDGTKVFSTMGDNNNGQLSFEKQITEEQLVGKTVMKLAPYAGWIKLVFYDWKKPIGEKGFCNEN